MKEDILYKKLEIETASPAKLVEMTYELAIKFVREAKRYFEEGNIEKRSQSIGKAISAIAALRSCLDMEKGAEIASALDKLYDYMIYELSEANIRQEAKRLNTVLEILKKLLDGWKEVRKKEERK